MMWSGPGCENNPEFELIDRDPATGIGRFRKRTSIPFEKKDDTMTEAEIKKSLERDPLLKFQAERGQVRKVAAELELDKQARAILEQGVCKSYANAYCRAMDLNPELAEIAVGNA